MTYMKCTMIGVVVMATATMSFAADYELPSQVTWSAYDTGSAGYNQAVAIGSALQNDSGVSLRVLPGKNDVSRIQPLRTGRVAFSATSTNGMAMAQEGVYEFANADWGPQPVRIVMASDSGKVNSMLAVAGDLGVTDYSELKGKRVSWVVGAPALNILTTSTLAYAGLTWDDVEKVEFGGYGEAFRGLISGSTDTVFTVTNSGLAYEAAAGPRGLTWPPIDPENTEGIKRLQEIVPVLRPNRATVGANIDGTDGVDGVTSPYPTLVAYKTADEDLVYNMVKAMDDLYDDYENGSPGADGWALKYQNMQTSMPYHEGAIRYYKEKGMWTDEDQAHNDELLRRQSILIEAWNKLKSESSGDFTAEWAEVRSEVLKNAGLKVYFPSSID